MRPRRGQGAGRQNRSPARPDRRPDNDYALAWSLDREDGYQGTTLGAFPRGLSTVPFVWKYLGATIPMMLAALSTYHAGMPQIVLVAEPHADDTKAMQTVLQSRYVPTAIVVPVFPQHRETLARLLPWVGSMRMIDNRATAYVCRDFTCQAPTTAPAQLEEQLGK